MASSSSTRTWKYDVFPSFSGEDVRKSFLSHLLKELDRKSVITFIDHGIERSSQIAPALLLAIRQSRISIVVFSKKYASSTWCLNELAEIHECCKGFGLMVIPVFYDDVDPSHVRKQTGEFGKAFDKTCEGKTEDEKQRWIQALKEVANIAGEDSHNRSDDSKMIEKISKDVLNKLLLTPSDDFHDFVGIGAHVEAIMDSKLCLESGGMRMVGILGPSGIGKSTIARALYSRLSSTQFDHRTFASYKRAIENRKVPDVNVKLAWAQQFLSDILCQKDIKIESLGVVEQRLKHRKVLIVLDDVDEIELLQTLVEGTGWFGFGSRIIVVTQDRALLESHGVDLIYEVDFPSEDLALQMFCQSAFRQTSPTDGFMELAAEVAKLAGNLPLGLNVLGSSLRGKDKEYWEKMMPKFRKGLNGKIEKTLRISYDGLDEKDDQDIFVYIACLFNGESVYYINNLLAKIFGTSVDNSLTTLADKSLVRIIGTTRFVQMHILLQKLGREIVRSESTNNPGKRRFLVDLKDISDVLENNTGTKNVLGIRLDTSEIDEPLFIDENSFEGMRNLQFIKFFKEWWLHKTGEVRFYLPHQGLIYLPRKLRLLHWDDYPAKYIPSNFNAKHLVELIMKSSKLEKLWEGAQPLRSLKVMNLSGSKDLKEIPDLSSATYLEILNLSYCTSLVTLSSSIRNLKKLRFLIMVRCSNLEVLPADFNIESLDYLSLRECSRLRNFPRISRNISRLYLDGIAMEEEDCLWIENLSRLIQLVWKNCPLRYMPSNFHPEHLSELVMRDSKLEKLWEGVQSLRILRVMDFKNSKNLKEIPDLSKAINLMKLDLSGCESLKEIPDLSKAINLEELYVSPCKSLKEIPDLPKAINLITLTLDYCGSLVKVPSSIQNLDKLSRLDIIKCTSLEILPTNINLVSLTSLNLSGCSRLTSFPQLSTSIKELNLNETAIEVVPSWIENMVGLTRLLMRGCQKLRKISAIIWNLKNIEHVDFTHCGGITSVSDTSLVKTVAGLYAERSENHPMDMYPSWSCSNTEFLFCDCFNLDQDAQKFISQSDSRFAVLPVKELPTYFTHRTRGSSLTVPLPQSSLSQNHLRFTACIDFAAGVNVHWKFRGVTGMCNIDLGTYVCKMDHLLVFQFDFCLREEVDGPPSQLDCNNVELEFKLRNTGFLYCTEDLPTIPIFNGKIKGCGVRLLNVSPSFVANDRSSENEYTDKSRESDLESGKSKKRMQMTVETSEEDSNSLCVQTAVNSGSMAQNLELSLGLLAAPPHVSSRSKVPWPSTSSRNFHGDGDGPSLNLSLSPSDPCLEEEALYFDPMITEQQHTGTPSEDTSSSPQLINFFQMTVEPSQVHSNLPGGKTAVNSGSMTPCVEEEARSSEESGRSKKRMRMTVTTSQEHSNSLCGKTAVNSGSMATNLELSLGLVGTSPHVSSRSKVPSQSNSSRNFHGDGDGPSLNLSLSPYDPCLDEEASYVDPMIREQQESDTWIPSEDISSSPQLINFFR